MQTLMMSEQDLSIVCSKIDQEKSFLNSISLDIWNKPECDFEEVYAHDILTAALIKYGFEVKKHYVLPTAFRAEFGPGNGPTIAVLLEYDALPDIGHACGHNLIAEAGLAAVIGIKAAMEADKNIKGKVVALGTPAEESGGGKIKLINGGAFNDIDAAMMVHPAKNYAFSLPMLSRLSLSVEYEGKSAHASAFPWEGINALDAAVSLYQSLGLMRQQTKPTSRISVYITQEGSATNVIPYKSRVEIVLRASVKKEVQLLRTKVENCIKAAAISTGCSYIVVPDEDKLYENLNINKYMTELFTEFFNKIGLPANNDSANESLPMASSDMGNVSYVVPSIHPFYRINGTALNHTKEFTTAAGSIEAQEPTLSVAKAMAMTALALIRDPKKMKQAKALFDETIS